MYKNALDPALEGARILIEQSEEHNGSRKYIGTELLTICGQAGGKDQFHGHQNNVYQQRVDTHFQVRGLYGFSFLPRIIFIFHLESSSSGCALIIRF